MEYVQPYRPTSEKQLQSLVEHRSRFNLDFCELNIFETRQQAQDFQLSFEGFTVTSMLRGKKIMHLKGMDEFEYVPGETVIAPANTLMRIDFPEAEMENPTQCTALVIDNQYLNKQLSKINNSWKGTHISQTEWAINPQELVLKNSRELAHASNRMLQVLTSNDPFKEYQAETLLRELVLNMMKMQNLHLLRKEHKAKSNSQPFHAVLNYIDRNLVGDIKIEDLCRVAGMSKSSFYRAFTEEYGITPVQLILEERLKKAKEMLQEGAVQSIKEAAYASGFNDPNYFTRAFRKVEGVTPSAFRNGS